MCTTRYFSTFVENTRLFPTPFLSLLTLLTISIPTLPVAIGDTKLKANDFEATKTFAGVIQVEAEILELTTYLVEDSPFSSGRKVISLRGIVALAQANSVVRKETTLSSLITWTKMMVSRTYALKRTEPL